VLTAGGDTSTLDTGVGRDGAQAPNGNRNSIHRGTREKPIDSQAKRNDALNRSGCRPSGSAIAAPVVLSSYEARPPVLVAGGSKDSIFDHCLSRSLINRSTDRMEHTPCPMESLSVG
jgi:hypothetical protein